MMRNLVRSRFCSSNAPSLHRNELPGAENSGSENTSPTAPLVLRSPPMKRRSVEVSRFLATTLRMCAEQKVTVGVLGSEGVGADLGRLV